MIRRTLTCVVVGAAAPLPAFGASPGLKVYTNEHVDHVSINYGAPSETGRDVHSLLLTSRDETNKVEYNNGPNSLVYMAESASLTVPTDSFLGDAGDEVWVFPQSNDAALPFVGVSTEDKTDSGGWSCGILDDDDLAPFRGLGIQPGEFANDQVTLKLVDMTGPDGGEFKLYFFGSSGDLNIIMDTEDGIDSSDRRFFSPNVHEHYNWAFTEPGLYKLTFQASGTPTATGETITSVPSDFYFGVGVNAIEDPCPADLDGDGVVGSFDLGSLLGDWGGDGPSDLTGDGIVGASDLGSMLGSWGPCE